MKDSIASLIQYWKDQGIEIVPCSFEEIERIEEQHTVHLPNDFKYLYSHANGMGNLYPNYMDKEGFLFYPVEAVTSVAVEFSLTDFSGTNLFLFAEHLHKSWWYGVEVIDDSLYTIGIIPDVGKFTTLTSSLADFIDMYINDSDKLYEF